MIHTLARRTKLYRQYVTPVRYRPVGYYPTAKAIPVILNVELREMHAAIREKKGIKP